MHPARSAISKTRPPLPNLLREDILLEGFEQAGKKVTEHVLDSIREAAGADRILLLLKTPSERQAWIARQRGCQTLPTCQARPVPDYHDGSQARIGNPHWPLGVHLDLAKAGNAALLMRCPTPPPANWLRDQLERIRSLLSISVLLDGPETFHPAPNSKSCVTGTNPALEISTAELRQVFPEIVGESVELEGVLRSILQIADSDIPVLIQGESGTGKELVAAAIHRLGGRKKKPFVCENCGAIAEQLAEAELFGHEKGAFTGACVTRPGLVERAQGGTLFLDEVSEMEPSLQKKLLRVLQEKAVRRVGGDHPQPIDFRLVSATNRDLEEMVRNRKFREDLYYRLNVTSIRLPALRQRKEDIPSLVAHFAGIHSRRGRQEGPYFSPEILATLCAYHWPGNIRELDNEVWRIVETVEGEVKSWHLSTRITSNGGPDRPGHRGPLEQMEKEVLGGAIADALRKTHGNRAQAARLLGIGRATLYRRLERYDLTRDGTPVNATMKR